MIGSTAGYSQGWPATSVLRLGEERPMERRPEMERRGAEVVLAAVEHPPRIGDVRPIGSLVSEVLSRYGLKQEASEKAARQEAIVFDAVA